MIIWLIVSHCVNLVYCHRNCSETFIYFLWTRCSVLYPQCIIQSTNTATHHSALSTTFCTSLKNTQNLAAVHLTGSSERWRNARSWRVYLTLSLQFILALSTYAPVKQFLRVDKDKVIYSFLSLTDLYCLSADNKTLSISRSVFITFLSAAVNLHMCQIMSCRFRSSTRLSSNIFMTAGHVIMDVTHPPACSCCSLLYTYVMR